MTWKEHEFDDKWTLIDGAIGSVCPPVSASLPLPTDTDTDIDTDTDDEESSWLLDSIELLKYTNSKSIFVGENQNINNKIINTKQSQREQPNIQSMEWHS